MHPSSALNKDLWISELTNDPDKEFLTDGVLNGFQLLPKDAVLQPAEMSNYHSTTSPDKHASVEAIIRQEIAAGNFLVTSQKPTIISALGAVPKADSSELRLIHDCSMPHGRGVNSYIQIEKQHFQTLDDAVACISKGSYLAKIDLRHAYRSIPVHPSNHHALGLKWSFSLSASTPTYFIDTCLSFESSSSPGIFHRITQSIRRMMARRGDTVVFYLDDFLVVGPST